MTRRAAMIALVVLAGVVATGVGTVSAQPTQSGVKAKAKAAGQAAQAKWESLTPAYQQQLLAEWKMSEEAAKAKWATLSATQQQELRAKAGAVGQAVKQKYQSLPK